MPKRFLLLLLIAAILVPAAFIFARNGENAPPAQPPAVATPAPEIPMYLAQWDEPLNPDEEYLGEHYTWEEYAWEQYQEFRPPPPRWYRSNSAGMALEFTPSRLVAMRNEYALSVEIVHSERLPEILVPYHHDAYTVELRTLFKDGSEHRHQWIFRDDRNFAMLVSSGSSSFFGGEPVEDGRHTGFIEFRNSDGSTVRERVFEEDLSQWEFRFFFDGAILRSTETWFKAAPAPPAPDLAPLYVYAYSYEYVHEYPYGSLYAENEPDAEILAHEEASPEPAIPTLVLLFTDYFRYTRIGALRAIDRVFHEGAEGELGRISFPRGGPQFYSLADGASAIFYTPDFILSAMVIEEGARAVYTLDSRGRVLNEIWRDAENRITGELINTWDGDRIMSVLWRTDYDERLVEYEYNNDGDRIVERNIRRGELERMVTRQNGIDIEEIFRHGRVILRAVWEDGLKISEERVAQIGGGW